MPKKDDYKDWKLLNSLWSELAGSGPVLERCGKSLLRAFILIVVTDSAGQVVIRKDQDTLGDDGLILLDKHFSNSAAISNVTISSHDIGPLGIKKLAFILSGCGDLQELNLSGNRLCSEGAITLANAIKVLTKLIRLDIGSNEIEFFPKGLALCTGLTHLSIQHNRIEELPYDLGLHPQLQILNVLNNPIRNLKQENLSSSTRILKELFEGKVAEACEKAKANFIEQPAILSKHVTYTLEELNISVPDRWNPEFSFLARVLAAYSDLKSLNHLHEWPQPPLAMDDTWTLKAKLQNPLYEAVFVRNRCLASQFLTRLDISNNDLRAGAALAIAEAISLQTQIVQLDVTSCTWDEGISVFAKAVRTRLTLQNVNGLEITDPSVWDFRGAITSIVEVEFIVSKMEEYSSALVSLDLRRNSISSISCESIGQGLGFCTNLSQLNALSVEGQETSWDLRKKLLDGAELLKERKDTVDDRNGFLSAELLFISTFACKSMTITEIDLSANELRDEGVLRIAQLLLPTASRLTTMHLHQNGISKVGATSLGNALRSNLGLENLRMNENCVQHEGFSAIVTGLVVRKNNRPKGFTGVWGRVVQLHFDTTDVGPTLPEQLCELLTLEVLSLRCNHLTTLSADLCLLTNLRTLAIDQNPIEFPDPTIVHQGFLATMKYLTDLHAFGVIRDQHFKNLEQKPFTTHKTDGLDARRVELEAKETILALSMKSVSKKTVLAHDEHFSALKAESVVQLNRHGREVLGLSFGPGMLATCSADRSIKLWEPVVVQDGSSPRWSCCDTLRGHLNDVRSVSFSPSSLFLVLASGSSDGTIRLWTLSDNLDLPDARASESQSKWTCAQVLHVQKEQNNISSCHAVNVVAFYPTGDDFLLATGNSEGLIQMWGPNFDEVGASGGKQKHRSDDISTLLGNNDNFLALKQIYDEYCHRDIFGRSSSRTKSPDAAPSGMNFLQLVAFCEDIGVLPFIGKALIFNLFGEVSALSKLKTGELDFTAFGIVLWRICMAAKRSGSGHDEPQSNCEWTAFGTLQAIAGVHVKDLEYAFSPYAQSQKEEGLNWVCHFDLEGHEADIHGLVWLPSSILCLASCSADETVRLWQYSEKKGRGSWAAVFQGTGHEGPVLSLSCGISMGNAVLASSSSDGSVMLWEVIERRFELIGKAHVGYTLRKSHRIALGGTSAVCSCSIRDDGDLLAAVDDVGRISLWALDDGRWNPAGSLDCHGGKVAASCFGRDDNSAFLATGSHDFSICLIDTRQVRSMQPASQQSPNKHSKDGTAEPKLHFPRREGQPFHSRKKSKQYVQLEKDDVSLIMASLTTAPFSKGEIEAEHSGRILLCCQPASSRHSVQLDFLQRSVWERMPVEIRCLNVHAEMASMLSTAVFVSPLVQINPQGTMFRKPVRVRIPHQCATLQNLKMVHFSGELVDGLGRLEAVPGSTVRKEYAEAHFEMFSGFIAVLYKGVSNPEDRVYCLVQTTDGIPLTSISLRAEQTYSCQIEIIPSSCVMSKLSLAQSFWMRLGVWPTYNIVRGSALGRIAAECIHNPSRMTIGVSGQGEAQWQGFYLIIPFRLHIVRTVSTGDKLYRNNSFFTKNFLPSGLTKSNSTAARELLRPALLSPPLIKVGRVSSLPRIGSPDQSDERGPGKKSQNLRQNEAKHGDLIGCLPGAETPGDGGRYGRCASTPLHRDLSAQIGRPAPQPEPISFRLVLGFATSEDGQVVQLGPFEARVTTSS